MRNDKDKQLKYEKALEYEIFTKEEYGFAKEKIQNAKCIFDIGWHIWLFSQRCRNIGSHAEIHYFEPVGEFYDKTKSTLWNDSNIILNNLWIASKSWKWTILLNEKMTMQSSKYSSFLNPKWKEIVVNFITLKDYLELHNIDKIDVLKMDIEWMEHEVLSSRWDFEWGSINNLIAEVHLLNDKMKTQRDQIFPKIRNIFWDIRIINSWYREEIFLLRTCKETWL